FTFTQDLASALARPRVRLATPARTSLSGFAPDFVLPAGMLAPRDGRVCYFVNPPQAAGQPTGVIDCVAYGKFKGDHGPFGPPTPITPDNRALRRIALTGRNVDDWGGVLAPDPTNDAGDDQTLSTLCGDGAVSQGEQCDGDALAGATCASLDYASGTLTCTFSVALCFDHADARLPRCRAAPIESWTLVKPTSGADVEGMLAAAARLGPSSAAGTALTFSPPLEASERCTDAVAIVVPTR